MPDEKWGVSELRGQIYWAWWLRERMLEEFRRYTLMYMEKPDEVCDEPIVVDTAVLKSAFERISGGLMADKLTEKQKLDYLQDPTKCPFCGSEQMQADSENDGETPSHQNFRCDCAVCKRSWVEVYKLERIELDESSDVLKFNATVDIVLRYDVVVDADAEEEAKARIMLMSPDAVRAAGQCASVLVKVIRVEHEHQWGEVELARFTGNPHRKCKVPFCNAFTMDLNDDEDDSVV